MGWPSGGRDIISDVRETLLPHKQDRSLAHGPGSTSNGAELGDRRVNILSSVNHGMGNSPLIKPRRLALCEKLFISLFILGEFTGTGVDVVPTRGMRRTG